MSRIVPSILTDSKEDILEKVEIIKSIPDISRISIDIIDGLFADNITVGVPDLWDIDFGDLELDIQLMVVEPVDFLGLVSGIESTDTKNIRVFAHVERMGSVQEYMQLAREFAFSVGLAFDLYTPYSAVTQEELLRSDAILQMCVPVGFSGQEFQQSVLEKIASLRASGYSQAICVDGGINQQTVPACLAAGASDFAITSAIWGSEDPREEIQALIQKTR